MQRLKTLWSRLDCAPDLTQASIGKAISLSALWIVLLWFFYHVPKLDVIVAGLFFHATDCANSASQTVCGSFPVSQNSLAKLVRKLLFYLPHLITLFLLVALIIKRIEANDKRVSEFPILKKCNRDWITKLSLTLLSVLIGPIFIVNVFLKEWSGRPRPMESNLFGGDLSFVPAGSFGGTCTGNCSFISGEAAGAGLLVCIIPLLPTVWRRRIGPPLMIASIATPLLRVAFGGHYLSDALLGWLSSPVVFAWVFAIYHVRNRPQKRSYSGR
ncbi:phosphatase PAP2 family protein [Rhizobium sp.]|jgi:lipid A 4'-phosphatase|uniref:phosphatase PAP2 family protein n=1 Tax=Rhizobium sp. TaxID=391 RepID=UPI002AA5F9C8